MHRGCKKGLASAHLHTSCAGRSLPCWTELSRTQWSLVWGMEWAPGESRTWGGRGTWGAVKSAAELRLGKPAHAQSPGWPLWGEQELGQPVGVGRLCRQETDWPGPVGPAPAFCRSKPRHGKQLDQCHAASGRQHPIPITVVPLITPRDSPICSTQWRTDRLWGGHTMGRHSALQRNEAMASTGLGT